MVDELSSHWAVELTEWLDRRVLPARELFLPDVERVDDIDRVFNAYSLNVWDNAEYAGPGSEERDNRGTTALQARRRGGPVVGPNHKPAAVNSQVKREEMHLLPGPADDRPQFAEIGSCVPRRILLRHEHLPTPGGNCTRRCSADPLWAGEAP